MADGLIISCVLATSLDGKIATRAGENEEDRYKSGFTNADDKRWVEDLLRQTQAVIVGAESIRAAGHIWHLTGVANPRWYIYSNSGRFGEQSSAPVKSSSPSTSSSSSTDLSFTPVTLQEDVEKYIVSKAPLVLPKAKNLSNIVYGDNEPAQWLTSHLRAQGIARALLFGGRSINQIFFEKCLVDELIVTLCPIVVGNLDAPGIYSSSLVAPTRLTLTSSKSLGNHVFLNYRINK